MFWFDLIETTSFFNIWYWIITVVAWSMTAHWTMGVPYDALRQADRKGGDFAEHCDLLAHINARRLIYYFDRGGPYFIAFVGFMLALIGGWGFYQGYELAQAVFLLATPLVLTSVFSVRLAYRIQAEALAGEALRQALRRRRIWNQTIGMFAITLMAAAAVFHFIVQNNYFMPDSVFSPYYP
ncbi:MAG: component of SufBCD complex [Rhodobacteraceae bacterium]|nr:component of SufBCD complex [Paracoccaceae bacterium]